MLYYQPVPDLQKQPPRGVSRKSCSENMQQIYMRTPMPKCDFNKVALLCNFIEITLRHGCSPVNLLHIFRTPFPRNTSGWLLLKLCKDVLCKILISASKFKVQAFLICKKIRNTVNKKRGKSFPIIIFIKQIFNTHTCFF